MVSQRIVFNRKELCRFLAFIILLMLRFNSSKDKVPVHQSVLYFKLSTKYTSKPSHKLEFRLHLVIHQMLIQSIIYRLEELMIYSIAFFHNHRLYNLLEHISLLLTFPIHKPFQALLLSFSLQILFSISIQIVSFCLNVKALLSL